ncbi:MAG: glutathione peroxidase [Prolixibacteraceae bacterium]|nr:glutathione peroxidase [Prolixibacteraceae bacterium]MBN2772929.1 glutathione peroxidase [Prolixibacteraceae bacterium]
MFCKLLIVSILITITGTAIAQYKTMYDFSAKTIDGKMLDFSVFKGKKVMIVNTATKCSLAPQLKKLQELYEEYGGDDFEIIAFPSNDFGKREPGTNEEIKEKCDSKYGITFILMEKINVRGDSIHPVFKWLTSSEENGTLNAKVLWNFQKFLISEDGNVDEFINPWTGPENKKIIEWLSNN